MFVLTYLLTNKQASRLVVTLLTPFLPSNQEYHNCEAAISTCGSASYTFRICLSWCHRDGAIVHRSMCVGAHLTVFGVSDRTDHTARDAWPVRCRTYTVTFLASKHYRSSAGTKTILLGDENRCVCAARPVP